MTYWVSIQTAILFFPVLAFLITLPYMIREYHKYGCVYWYRTFLVYSFIFYLLVAYFLVILPLPSMEEVANLKTPQANLVPFSFLADFFMKGSFRLFDLSTYFTAMKETYFYVPVYNLILTIPFGIYLRYYFNFSFKKTVFTTFALSLFFELTQLSGLYFIYPRGYRLFDVDDLILNTCGGMIGYGFGSFLLKILPDREAIDETAFRLGKKVSMLRRMVLFFLDFLFFLVFSICINMIWPWNSSFWVSLVLYYVLCPYLFHGFTIGGKIVNVKIISTKKKHLSLWSIFLRQFLLFLFYFGVPIGCYGILLFFWSWHVLFLFLLVTFFLFLYYLFLFFFTKKRKQNIYEIMSHTRFLSTIQFSKKDESMLS